MEKIKIFDNCYLIKKKAFGDSQKGYLSFFEGENEIPFEIKRVYYIYDIGNPKEVRGPHAHKKLKQVFIFKGTATCLLDNGKEKKEIVLNSPDTGIFIGPGIWHGFKDFSKGTTIFAIASDSYEHLIQTGDYIRDYEDFLEYLRKNQEPEKII